MKLEGKIFEARLDAQSQGDEHIGARLREIRNLAGITQADLAARLNISQGVVSRVEGRKDILVSTLRDYLAALGATLRIDAQFSDAAALVTSMRETSFQFDAVDENQLLLPIIGETPYPLRRDVVFSIKPEYCEAIIEGRKTIELRRRFPVTAPVGATAFIYATSPTRALLGLAEIGEVHCRTPRDIWDRFSDRACITRENFDRYFEGVDSGVAIELKHARRLRRPLDLSELRERFSFEPPQSYLYATPKMREALQYECSQIPH